MLLKKLLIICGILAALVCYQIYSEVYVRTTGQEQFVTITIDEGVGVQDIIDGLEGYVLIRNRFLFEKYLVWKGYDRKIHAGTFVFVPPHTVARVAETLTRVQSKQEREITIIPGWTLRDIAAYFEREGLATEQEMYTLLGEPATRKNNNGVHESSVALTNEKPNNISFEGYLAPDTYRVFVDESIEDTIDRLLRHRDQQIDSELRQQIAESGRTFHEILTMASILQKESPDGADKPMIADLFWRRLDAGMALQADSTVHYIFGGGQGSVFTTAAQRDSKNPWNTYEYPGLPPGPIGTPSLEAIRAAANPEPNDYWFFLTTLDTGEVKYGRTLAEHNANVAKYLR